MSYRVVTAFLLTCGLTGSAYADGVCDAALVRSTYNRYNAVDVDWRVASSVTEYDYNEIKQKAGINAVIFGVPIGVSWDDFQRRVHEGTSTYGESLTRHEIVNVEWTGLDPNAVTPYSDCLKAQAFSRDGLHLAIEKATKTDISGWVIWRPVGQGGKINITVTWSPPDGKSLPKTVTAGTTPFRVDRPANELTLLVSAPGFGDSVTLTPLPKPPVTRVLPVNETEVYSTPQLASGACKGFGGWGRISSETKPKDWTIVYQSFELSGDRRCGMWAICQRTELTDKKVSYQFQTQGHDEQCYGTNNGIQYSTGILTVVWRHDGSMVAPGGIRTVQLQ